MRRQLGDGTRPSRTIRDNKECRGNAYQHSQNRGFGAEASPRQGLLAHSRLRRSILLYQSEEETSKQNFFYNRLRKSDNRTSAQPQFPSRPGGRQKLANDVLSDVLGRVPLEAGQG